MKRSTFSAAAGPAAASARPIVSPANNDLEPLIVTPPKNWAAFVACRLAGYPSSSLNRARRKCGTRSGSAGRSSSSRIGQTPTD